jgi:glycosyltransferase involved in cell wall biosynthesis
MRLGIRLFSGSLSVWWYRYWHARFLEGTLRKRLAATPDSVIYAQCPVSADVALRVRTSQPVVMAAHFNRSQADEWAGKGDIAKGGRLYWSIQSFEQRVLRQLDGIVYVSEFLRAEVERKISGLATIPAVVIPNPVPIEQTQERQGQPTRDLITVGTLEPRKNHHYLLEIIAEAAGRGHVYTLSIVGDGPERARLEEQARQLSIAHHVRFLGYTRSSASLLGEHRVYCHTSIMESFGIVVAEAMAAGTPVIATPVGGIPEVIRPGVDGVLWPLNDAPKAADLLIDLMEDDARRGQLADSAYLRARSDFSPEIVVKRLVEFLRETARL